MRNIIEIPGKFKAKQRPRFANGHTYTPQGTVNYENWVKVCYQQQSKEKHEGPLKVTIIANYPYLKSWNKKMLQEVSIGNIYPTKKPDADNVAKSILDALNGIAYDDDAQIVDLFIQKRYWHTEGILLHIEPK